MQGNACTVTDPKPASKMETLGSWEHGLFSGDFSHMRFHLEWEHTNGAILQSVQIQPVVLNQSIKKKAKKLERVCESGKDEDPVWHF